MPTNLNRRKARANVRNEFAREIQVLVWKEIIEDLSAKVPSLESHWLETL